MRIGTAIANEKTSVIVINKKIYELASIFKTSGFVEFLKNIANRAGATIKEISQLMTSNRNVKLQFLNKLPKVSVEEQGIEIEEDEINLVPEDFFEYGVNCSSAKIH